MTISIKLRDDLSFPETVNASFSVKNPILDIAARFWEKDRYQAFQICYRAMRKIDDLVDNLKIMSKEIPINESFQVKTHITNWLDSLKTKKPSDSSQAQLVEICDRFRIPVWPWEQFTKAMLYDLENDGYSTFIDFLRYSEGAAVAPASIFVHLCGLNFENHQCKLPCFNIRKAARPLAIFSYLVHIIRDFQVDNQFGLNYFAADLLSERGLTKSDLRQIAKGGPISNSFRDLITFYVRLSRFYQEKALKTFEDILPQLESRYRLSLLLIHDLYLQILDRVDVQSGNFTFKEVNPPPEALRKQIRRTISNFE
jgi:phytoene/squalene synthetase